VELRRIQQSLGITTIFVTHDQAEAMNLSDTIAVMSEGRVVQRGTAQEIYQLPANRFVADFIGQINFIEATVLGRDGPWDVAQAGGAQLLIPPGAPGAVTIGVRPHQITFDAEGSGNRLSGHVLSTSFGGNLCRTRVRVGDTEWVVESRPSASMRLEGSPVVLTWPPDQTVVFRN
jgi:ABC-type Fe3+/spermidine/putrescine transport system ATPase subunit